MNDFLSELTALIAQRRITPKPGSYTNRLLDDPGKAAQKVGEEATEVIVAALSQSDEPGHRRDGRLDLPQPGAARDPRRPLGRCSQRTGTAASEMKIDPLPTSPLSRGDRGEYSKGIWA